MRFASGTVSSHFRDAKILFHMPRTRKKKTAHELTDAKTSTAASLCEGRR
jgi:hypothetical protein